jgi:hypothetical protein
MEHTDREVEPFFSQPIRQITMMLVVLVAFAFGAYIAYPRVAPVFLENPWLNGFIMVVFFIGLIACVWQVVELIRAVSWVMAFTRANAVPEDREPSRLLAPLAALMRSRGARTHISASSQRSILDSVATRIEEARDITRYISSLLIFLGLLGTFYGLATTVPAVVDTIRSLAPQAGDTAVEVFGRLMGGLEAQLGGMGTAFASSLLGLAGSLVVGLLELFAHHGQNRFYRELEDWLSSITRLGFAGAEGEGSGDTGAIAALAEHMAEQMETLQTLYANSDASRSSVDETLTALARRMESLAEGLAEAPATTPALDRLVSGQERLAEALAEGQGKLAEAMTDAQGRLAETLTAGQGKLAEALAKGQELSAAPQERVASTQERLVAGQERIAKGQERMIAAQEQLIALLARQAEAGGASVDAEARMRLRSIDVQLLRILEEMSAGRQESLADLRADLAALTKAVRNVGREPPPVTAAQARRG